MRKTTASAPHTRRAVLQGLAAAPLAACAATPLARSRKTDVLVLGAGLAGLAAARQLEAEGLEALVLEAQSRVGGRMYTADDLPDRAEYGGIQVGGSYGNMRTTAAELGVDIAPYPFGDRMRGMALNIGGETITPDKWEGADANRLPAGERVIPPYALMRHYIRKQNPLTDALDWRDPNFSSYDKSLYDVMKDAGASEEALRLANINANNNGIRKTSALQEWRSGVLRRQDQISEVVVGGSSRLPEAMAASLSAPVILGAAVKSISASNTGVRAETEDGRTYDAKYCVCTMPAPVLRRLNIDAALAPGFANAVKADYTKITQIFLETDPFWEEDGLPPMMWTDGPLERFFPRIDQEGRIIGYKIWVNGQGAAMVDNLSDAETANLAVKELARIRPASAGKALYTKRYSWAGDPHAGGAYIEWPAGKAAETSRALAAPAGRLHFAGEHTSLVNTGMEGAFQSARTAVDAILDEMRPA